MKQKKFIEVCDNLIHPSIANKIESLLTSDKVDYHYVQNITGGGNKKKDYLPGFSYNFIISEPNFYTPYHFFLSHVLYKLSDFFNFHINTIVKARSFLQVPTFNSSPNSIHTDLPYDHWVCLYYVTDSDGDTILFDDDNNEIQRVPPKKGRIVFFDGSIKHCSSSPSKTHRSVLNFDFIGEFLEEQK